jgi:uncharacterized protein
MATTIVPGSGSTQARSSLRSFDLMGPAGRLEAILNEGSPDAPYATLLCHPHPKGGGTLHSKVIYHAMKVVNDAAWGFGWPALRFNFRGTGLSEGAHDGVAESEDVRAALDWLENEYKRPVVLLGFSFGAAMAIRACCGSHGHSAGIASLIALGLPTEAEGRRYEYRSLARCAVPKLFLSGDQDQYAPASQLAQIAESAAQPKQLAMIAGADHFFTGQLDRMQQALQGWLRGQFQ